MFGSWMLEYVPSQLDVVLTKVRCDIDVIANYSRVNQLKLNLAETKISILDSATHTSTIDLSVLPIISLCDTVLPHVSHARSPGVMLQSNLSWNMHVSSISSQVHATLNRLKYYENLSPPELRIELLSTLIFPLFDNCYVVSNDLTSEQNIELQRLMNYTIRYIFNLRRDQHITPFRQRLKWLTVSHRES